MVGLQEVSLWRDQDVSDIVTGTTAPNATHVVYDFLAMVQAELRAGGTAYSAMSTSTNADVEAPRSNSASPNGFTDVRPTDRDVILVRAELADKFSGAASGHYKDQFTVPSVVGPLTFTRGWVSIDYRPDANRTVRIIATHLEIAAGPAGTTQVAQGDPLLRDLVAPSPHPVVVLADINSADGSTTPTYANLTKKLDDAWSVTRPNDPGLSCCTNEGLTPDRGPASTSNG